MRVSCRSTSSQAGSSGPLHAVAMSEQFVEVRIAVAADDHQLVAVELLDAGTPIGHDLAQLRQDQVEDFGHAQRAPERLGGGAERLGLLARGALGLEQPSILDRHRGLGGECGRELPPAPRCRTSASNLSMLRTPMTRSPMIIGAQIHPRMRPLPCRSLAKCGLSDTSAKTCGRFDRTTWTLRLVSSSRSKPTPIRPPRSSRPRAPTITRRLSLDHLDRTAVVRHDPLQLVEDRLDRVLEAQRLPEHLRHGQ